MKPLTTILFTVLTGTTFGQTLKSYSGSYEGGQATYQYYENVDFERIFNGKFSYTDIRNNLNLSGVHIPSGTEITGTYKDNLKTGIWTAKETLSSYVPQLGNTKVTMVLSGSFVSGKRQGPWTMKSSVTSAKKNGASTALLNFNNNILTGSVDIENVKGNLDNQGKFIQSWSIKDEETEYIAEFRNNVFVKLIKRETSKGTILFKYDNQNNVNLFLDNQKEFEKVVQVNGKRYIILDCDKLDKFYNEDNPYNENDRVFHDFYELIVSKINAFDRTINRISHGSTGYQITVPQVIYQLQGETNEEREIIQNKVLLEDEKLKAQKAEQKEQQELQEAKRKEEQEEERKKQEAIRQFENTDYGKLQKAIKNKFRIWQVKSDFETASDYETRLKNQSTDKLKVITDEIVNSEKKNNLRIWHSQLGNYDVENQIYPLYINRLDTILLSIPKNLAALLTKTIANKRVSFGRSVMYVLPTDVVMVNNKWAIAEAVVLFDNFWTGTDFRDQVFKRFYKENGSYYYDREYVNFDKMAKDIKKYKIENLKDFENATELPKEVFFYEWKMSLPVGNKQKLEFTLEDLKMTSTNINMTK